MKLPNEAVQEFIEIYQKQFGEVLPYEKADVMAQELLQLYILIAK